MPAFVAAFELSLSFVALAFVELVPAANDVATATEVAADTDDVAEFVAVAFCDKFVALSPITFDEPSLLFEFDVTFDAC